MSFQALGAGERRYGRSQFAEGSRIELLNRDDLDVVGGGEASAEPGDTVGRQNVIRARRVVARGFGAEWPDENAARVADLREKFLVVDREMLRRETVG